MREELSKQTPTRTYCKRNRPLPYYNPNYRRPSTGSLPSTFAPPDHPFFSVGIPLPPPPARQKKRFLSSDLYSLSKSFSWRAQNSSCRVCTLKVIHIFCNVDCTTCFTLCRWLLFYILPLLTVLHTVLVSVVPPSPTPIRIFFSFKIWNLCLNSLTRELKIRVVGFALEKLFTHFEMLIVSPGRPTIWITVGQGLLCLQ